MMNINSSKKDDRTYCCPPKTPVFIVSTGRSGTTTLTQILQIHPDVCCFNEMQPPLRTEGFMNWANYWPALFIEKRILDKREKLITQVAANRFVYIEGTPPASHLIRELYKLFNARFIHLYCDGRNFIRRAAEKGWHKKRSLLSMLFISIRRQYLMRVLDGGKIDRWLIPPSSLKTQIEKLAWFWAEVNEIILYNLSQLPLSHRFSLKLEDLDKSMLVRLHEYIGIRVYPEILAEMIELMEKLANSSKLIFPDFEKWSEYDKKCFEKIAGDMMQKLNYDLNTEKSKY